MQLFFTQPPAESKYWKYTFIPFPLSHTLYLSNHKRYRLCSKRKNIVMLKLDFFYNINASGQN